MRVLPPELRRIPREPMTPADHAIVAVLAIVSIAPWLLALWWLA